MFITSELPKPFFARLYKNGKAFCKDAQKQLYVLQEYENEGNERDIYSSMLCQQFISYEVPADKTERVLH